MITIEEKLKVFDRLVVGKARQEFRQRLDEVSSENRRIMDAHRARVDASSREIIEKFTGKARSDGNKTVSRALRQKKKRVLEKKQQLADRLFQNVKEKAAAFTAQPAYCDFFGRCLSEAAAAMRGEDGIMLMATGKDIRRFEEEIFRECERNGFPRERVRISVSGEDMIGGVVAVNHKGTMRVDCSISALLEDRKNMIGKKLYDGLKQAEDENE